VRASRLRPCIATSARRSDRVASEGGRCAKRGRGEEAPGRAALSNKRRECQPAGANTHAPPAGERLTAACAAFRWQPPAARAGLCADLMRRLLAGALQREKTSRAACWRAPRDLMRRLLADALQRENLRAPPAGGRRGQVEFLAHAYATCAVMSGLDKGP
jgi:hypothetical protein